MADPHSHPPRKPGFEGDDPSAQTLAPEPRSVDAGRGIAWLTEGWDFFRRTPLNWIAMAVLVLIGVMAVAWIPVVGQLVTTLLSILFAGGLMLGCRALDRGEDLAVAHLFAGFRTHLSPLLVIGALYVAGLFILIVTVSLLTGGAVLALIRGDVDAGGALASVLVALLASAVMLVPLGMATWFAPALVTLQRMAPVDAMKLSFRGCLRNVSAFLVYGVLCLILSLLATLPAGLGWLVFLPVLAASVYAGYKDIFLHREG
ncbi:MAG: hypothetical protein EHM59_10250 [Betaproteobacteria bacterium]|nr:MAG: hypothetical protein EHM59_10250 [Betaproteobacteria bacterium]